MEVWVQNHCHPEFDAVARFYAPCKSKSGEEVELSSPTRLSRLSLKQLQRTHERQIWVPSLVVGDHDFMQAAFRKLRLPPSLTQLSCYPKALTPWMGRKVWSATLQELRISVREGSGFNFNPLFVKPQKSKLFTGLVLHSPGELELLATFPGSTPIYCAGILPEILGEFRCFVVCGELVGVKAYTVTETEGARSGIGVGVGVEVSPSRMVVQAAVEAYEASSEAPTAYAVDFAVVSGEGKDNGTETVVVEVNDGFALGSYGLAEKHYVDVLKTRWSELRLQAVLRETLGTEVGTDSLKRVGKLVCAYLRQL